MIYLGQKEPVEENFQNFEWLCKNWRNYSCHIWNQKSVFLTLFHYSVSWEIFLLYFFGWDFIWFRQKETIKVQNFRVLIAHMKAHQICTLIGSFCWNYIKVQLKKCWRLISQETKRRDKVPGKTNFLSIKWQEFRKFWLNTEKSQKFGFEK